jgi:hypothetical protein
MALELISLEHSNNFHSIIFPPMFHKHYHSKEVRYTPKSSTILQQQYSAGTCNLSVLIARSVLQLSCFKGTYCPHLQGQRVSQTRSKWQTLIPMFAICFLLVPHLAYSLTLMRVVTVLFSCYMALQARILYSSQSM